MSDHAPIEPDPAILGAEDQLRRLEDMAEFGMGLLRDLKEKSGEADTVEAFIRLSRAVRLTFALQTKTHQEIRMLKGENVQAREFNEARAADESRVARESAARRRKSEIKRLVLAVAESESESLEEYAETWDGLEQRAENDVRFHDLGEWKLRGAVERLCEDLGLHPDWDHWTGDGWDERYVRPHPRWRQETSPRLELTPSLEMPPSFDWAHAMPSGRRRLE